jgi:S1-C subfamily serine protease
MSVLDIALIILAVLFAISGYRQGFLTAVLSFVGFFGFAVAGAQIAEPVARWLADESKSRVVIAVAIVLAFALVGQVLATWAGGELRRRITWQPAQAVDAVLGAIVSVFAVLLVAWMVAIPLASSPYRSVSAAVRQSVLLRGVNAVAPGPVRELYASLRDIVRNYDFPEVFGPLVPTRVRPVQAPDPRLLSSRAVQVARPSVLKITGLAPACSRRVEGSGFVYAQERIMTNAHVVAGVQRPRVEVNGEQRTATVVLYNPLRDVAVLRVPGLGVAPLRFASKQADTGDDAIIAGYPQDGPFFVGPARIRDRIEIRGPDIYNNTAVIRESYTIRGDVRSGNSGGPLLSPSGGVYGVIFAAAVDQPETGFALTAQEVAKDAKAGASATAPVGTGDCA